MIAECPAVGVGGIHSDEWYEDGRCAWCGDHGPAANDNRLAARLARAQRRKDSLYEGRDEGETRRLQDLNSTRTSVMRWAPGENPHEEVDELHGYENIKVEVLEHTTPDIDKYAGLKGTASGLRCMECHQNEYLIIDKRSAQEVIESRPEVDWAIKMNRTVDQWRTQPELLLFCPGCHGLAQLMEQVLRIMVEQQNKNEV